MGKKKVGRKKLFETESTTIAFRVPREVKTEIKLIIKTIVDKYKLKKHE